MHNNIFTFFYKRLYVLLSYNFALVMPWKKLGVFMNLNIISISSLYFSFMWTIWKIGSVINQKLNTKEKDNSLLPNHERTNRHTHIQHGRQ